MKMKKLFAGLVATSMVAAMGTSAMAATITAEYEDAAITVNEAATIAAEENNVGTQMTVLVFKADDSENPSVSDDSIVYIDQDVASAALFTGMGVRDNTPDDEEIILEAGTYIVRIGGENLQDGIYEGVLTVSYEPDTPDTPTYTLGDVNNDGSILANDSGAILNHVVSLSVLTGDALLAADVTKDGSVLANDAGAILNYVVGLVSEF